jgi:hypothetical protein
MKVAERLRYFIGGGLVRIDDGKKPLLFLVDNSQECSQSKNFAFAPEGHYVRLMPLLKIELS